MAKKKNLPAREVIKEKTISTATLWIVKAQRLIVLISCILTPLMFFPLWSELSHAKFISFQITALFLFLLFILENAKESRIIINSHPLNLPVFIYLIVTFFSLYFAVNPLKGLDYLVKYLAYVLFFFVVSRLFRKVDDAFKSIIALYIACFITACFGIYQFIALNLQDSEKAFYYLYGSLFANPNYAGQFISVVIPLSIFIYWKLKGKTIVKALIISSSILILFYLILTFARCAWVSLIFGLFVIACTFIYLR
ncbi:hypothetical protein KKB18_03755, partial [bacterium]|nr:hypothetical protein [bacterium]